MQNYIQEGDTVDVVAPTGGVVGGNAYLIGKLFGIAVRDAAQGANVGLKTSGVFEVAKVSAQAWTQGAAIHWDNTAKLFTTVTTGNWFVGVATEAAANPSSVGRVRLNVAMALAVSA